MKLMDRTQAQTTVQRVVMLALLSVLFTSVSNAQEVSRWTWYETFQGSSNSAGQVLKLDSSLSYRLNEHFDVGGGVPVYSVRGSATATTPATGFRHGLGNVYLNLRGGMSSPSATFTSTLTTAAPTGNRDEGFSTGKVTVDWNNYIAVPVGRFTPFANLGVANTVSDTSFFVRPFSSLGAVGHFDGGATMAVAPFFSIGASAYAIEPGGTQTIIGKGKRLQPTGTAGSSAPTGTAGSVRNVGSPLPATETTGGADLARDHGFSGWFELAKTPDVSFQIGYSRSVHYDLNSVFFGLGFNVTSLMQK